MECMKDYQAESLSHDPIHGYIPFISRVDSDSEVAERQIIDHPWVQRLRQIHQLQTAWWVYPTAEHTRFQHVVGTMHLASRAIDRLHDSLREVCPDLPSRGYVECLMRMAALLHDVGHGPFGHFFDEHFLRGFGLTHETLGATIIREELGDLLRGVRRAPAARMEPGEQLDPGQIAFLITRPAGEERSAAPRWLALLRSLFCGIYTVDNLDFVLRDAFMTGYSPRAFDLDRLLHYTFFSEAGLTIHRRGLDALVRFMRARDELFRSVYFHRTVRAIDLTLADLFDASRSLLMSGDPLAHRDEYRRLTEWSLLVDVARWGEAEDERKRALAAPWSRFLARQVEWRMASERNLLFSADDHESSHLFGSQEFAAQAIRKRLPGPWSELRFHVDLPRHIHRPHSHTPSSGQNFLFQPTTGRTGPLTDDQLFRQMPISQRICRVYIPKDAPEAAAAAIESAVDELLGGGRGDDLTNM
jgi:hypothetical protein